MVTHFDPIEGRNAEIIETVMTCPEVTELSDALQFKIRLCVEEVEENILSYSKSDWVELRVDMEGDFLVITFHDGGIAFNPLAKEDPDITASLEDRQIGGLGIFICKQMMDSVEYLREGTTNRLIMKLKTK